MRRSVFSLIFSLLLAGLAAAQSPENRREARNLLDPTLSQWEVWMGVPHKSLDLDGFPKSTSSDSKEGVPLGLGHDPLGVFSVIKEDGKIILRVTGQIYGGLTTKEEFENYHLSLQFRWGEAKWEPRLNRPRDSGLLLHCVGPHGAFWNVWKRSLECQIQEQDVGDFFALAGSIAEIPSIIPKRGKRPVYQSGAPLRTISKSVRRGTSKEMPHGEWNTVEIYTIGNQMVHVVNGSINMVLLNTRQQTRHGEAPLTKGQIQIQSEGAEIDYRNIRLTPIKDFPPKVKAALK